VHHPSSHIRQSWGQTRKSYHNLLSGEASRLISTRVSRRIILPSVLWRNRQTVAGLVLRYKPRNWHGDFETQTSAIILRTKSSNRSYQFWAPNWETINLCFEAQLKNSRSSPSCARYTPYSVTPTSRSFGHWVLDLCLIILDPLYYVSYSYYDPRCCPPCRACYLHIIRQANTILHMKQE
jgi:hypothetical protein